MCTFCNLEHGMAEVSAAGHPSATEWFWNELRIIRERWDVLHHPFYVRWSAGELTPVELQRYAEAFDHAVIALAVVSRRAAAKACGMLKDILGSYAAEEEANIVLWRQFARCAGEQAGAVLDIADDPSQGTVECARVWAGDDARGLAVDLVTLYAIEASQPPLARTVLDALVERYGCPQGLATEYRRQHAGVDQRCGVLAQSALAGLLPAENPFGLLTQAELVHRAYWTLLDDAR